MKQSYGFYNFCYRCYIILELPQYCLYLEHRAENCVELICKPACVAWWLGSCLTSHRSKSRVQYHINLYIYVQKLWIVKHDSEDVKRCRSCSLRFAPFPEWLELLDQMIASITKSSRHLARLFTCST
jgi:hypothetical protein